MDDPKDLQNFIHSYSSHVMTVRAHSASPAGKLYLLSHPVPGNILAIKISIVSQGYGHINTDAEVCSTWFDATILRPMVSAEDKGKSILLSPPTFMDIECCGKLSNLSEELEQQGWKFVDMVPGDSVFRVCVNSNLSGWQTHEILWNAGELSDTDDNFGIRFINALKEGDRIMIWAGAKYMNRMNHVRHARVEVTLATPRLISFRSWLPNPYDPKHVSNFVDEEHSFFGSVGISIDDDLSAKEVLEKHGFRWSIEEIRSQPRSQDGPDSTVLALKISAEPSDPCASCGLPVSHVFATCLECQQRVCGQCRATWAMNGHNPRPRMIFNQNVDKFVKDGGGIQEATNTTSRRIRNEHYADYEPLDRDRREMRLLSIMPSQEDDEPLSCAITKTNIVDSKMSYKALSYCWGDMEKQRGITVSHVQKNSKGISQFGPFKALRVTENLFNALQNIRRTLRMQEKFTIGERFWIDALCINQGDNEERTHQVSMMGQIYANASLVWIWIGDSEEIQSGLDLIDFLGRNAYQEFGQTMFQVESAAGTKAMQEMHNWEIMRGGVQYQPADIVLAFSHVLKQPWFRRIWVLQEVFCAKGRVYVYAGLDHIINFDIVILGSEFAAVSAWCPTERSRGLIPTCISPLWRRLFKISHQRESRKPKSDDMMTLIELFEETSMFFEATDPRDKLFALLGLARETSQIASSLSDLTIPTRLDVDYGKSINEVFCDFTLWCIEHYRNLDVLSSVGETTGHFCPDCGRDSDYPVHPDGYDTDHSSWALWHRGRSYEAVANLTHWVKPFDISGTRDVDIAILQSSRFPVLTLQGLRVGTVKSLHIGVLKVEEQAPDLVKEFHVFNYRTRVDWLFPLTYLWDMVKSEWRWIESGSPCNWLGHPESAYKGDGEAMFRDLLETIMLRNPEPGTRNIWEEDHIAHKLTKYWIQHDPQLQLLPPTVRDFMEPLATQDATWHPLNGFLSEVPKHSKTLFMSDEWRLGLCPPEAELGDVIVVLFGGKVPFILRPKQSVPLPGQPDGQEWVFIGECFVHGRMHSGVVDEKLQQHVPIENFHLV